MTTYQALADKTRNAATLAEIHTAEAQHTKHYNNGTITEKELARLDRIAMDKFAELIEKQ